MEELPFALRGSFSEGRRSPFDDGFGFRAAHADELLDSAIAYWKTEILPRLKPYLPVPMRDPNNPFE